VDIELIGYEITYRKHAGTVCAMSNETASGHSLR